MIVDVILVHLPGILMENWLISTATNKKWTSNKIIKIGVCVYTCVVLLMLPWQEATGNLMLSCNCIYIIVIIIIIIIARDFINSNPGAFHTDGQ